MLVVLGCICVAMVKGSDKEGDWVIATITYLHRTVPATPPLVAIFIGEFRMMSDNNLEGRNS